MSTACLNIVIIIRFAIILLLSMVSSTGSSPNNKDTGGVNVNAALNTGTNSVDTDGPRGLSSSLLLNQGGKGLDNASPGLLNVDPTRGTDTNAAVPSMHSNVSPGRLVGSANTDDFVCYDNKLSVLMKDVPCPMPGIMGTRKVEVSNEMLEGLLTGMGGSLIKPVMSVEPPDYLSSFNLTDIGSSDWMNYNKSDLSVRLLLTLQRLEVNQLHLEQQLLRYLNCSCLHNLTHLAELMIDTMNTSTHLNLCSPSGATGDLSPTCIYEELLAAIENLKSVNHQIENLLINNGKSAAQTNGSSAYFHNVTIIDTGDDNNTDILIDQLLASLSKMESESKSYHLLHQKLQSAITNLKGLVYQTGEEFFRTLRIEVENHSFDNQDNEIPLTLGASNATAPAVGLILKGDATLNMSTLSSTENLAENSTDPNSTNLSQGHLFQNTSFFKYNQSQDETTTKDPTVSELGEITSLADILQSISAILNIHNETKLQDASMQTKKQLFDTLNQLYDHLNTITDMVQDAVIMELEEDQMLENMTSWHHLRKRTRRDTMGYAIASDSCQMQGANVGGTNYISLCSACVHTTVLDEDYFPRYLTEKICTHGTSSDDIYQNACLSQPGSFGGGAGGICQQQEFHIVVLQRVPGKCMRVSNHGQEMITDEWQSNTHPLRIGCECLIDQNSQFAKYVTFP